MNLLSLLYRSDQELLRIYRNIGKSILGIADCAKNQEQRWDSRDSLHSDQLNRAHVRMLEERRKKYEWQHKIVLFILNLRGRGQLANS